MTPKRKVVVVDGSNIATEGRSIPSLVQLDEATRAFQDEEPAAEIIVVVDATFEHRIAKDEQRRFRESAEADEVVTPPAGTIGRGDAFILKIARRANAVVLSNDSFQEFHAEHPWLFDEGRLVGGKPVPGVGWIFAERNPVKGPTSRAVRAKASSLSDTSDAEGTVGNPDAPASGRPSGRGTRDATASPKEPPTKRASATDSRAATTTKRASTASKASKAAVAPKPAMATPARGASKARATKTSSPTAAEKRQAASKAPAPSKRTRRAVEKPEAPAKRAARAGTKAAVDASTPAPAPASRARGGSTAPAKSRSATTTAPVKASLAPTNSARAFQALVDRHPLRSRVEGKVTTFTSHGAMVSVTVGKGLQVVCYAPLSGLGRPAPQRARDVLEKGEVRSFRVVTLDADRRTAELSIV
jgi:hypothetical protein